jgi:prepilin-type N-terminal cleavage/methylation domain-containing protein
MHVTRRPRPGESGFTLIELLISIVITGIIAVPLSMAVFSFFKNSNTTTSRLTESAQIQIASSYFARDVSLMGIRDTSATPAAPPLPPYPYLQSVWMGTSVSTGCGTLSGALIVGGDEYSAASPSTPTRFYVAYQLSGTDLHRVRCSGTTKTDTVIARNVTSAAPSCSIPCSSTPPPTTVTLALTVNVTSGNPGTYSATLTGSRAQSYPGSGS